MLRYNHHLKQPARKLRKNQTEAEQWLWHHIRRKQILGVQFYRQKPIGPYIVDFYAPKAKLVIELDGSQHQQPEQAGQDTARDDYLGALGLTILRFDNQQALKETPAVLEITRRVLENALPNPP